MENLEIGTLMLVFTDTGYSKAVVTEVYDDRFMVKKQSDGQERSYVKEANNKYKFEILTKDDKPLKSGKNWFGGWTFKEERKTNGNARSRTTGSHNDSR